MFLGQKPLCQLLLSGAEAAAMPVSQPEHKAQCCRCACNRATGCKSEPGLWCDPGDGWDTLPSLSLCHVLPQSLGLDLEVGCKALLLSVGNSRGVCAFWGLRGEPYSTKPLRGDSSGQAEG